MDTTTSNETDRSHFDTGRRISALPSLPRDLVQPFTLTATHRGGRTSRKGYDFQDWWIAYRLLGALSDSDELAYARIEGVEDLDLIVRRKDAWVTDLIAAALTLSSNSVSNETRYAFAKTFRDLCSRNQKMMYIAEDVFAANQSVLDKYPFEAFCLALLKTGRALNLSKDSLSQLEVFLGEKAAPLLP